MNTPKSLSIAVREPQLFAEQFIYPEIPDAVLLLAKRWTLTVTGDKPAQLEWLGDYGATHGVNDGQWVVFESMGDGRVQFVTVVGTDDLDRNYGPRALTPGEALYAACNDCGKSVQRLSEFVQMDSGLWVCKACDALRNLPEDAQAADSSDMRVLRTHYSNRHEGE